MINKFFAITISLLALISANTAWADDESCKIIHYKPGKVYTIKAALYKGTHIQLPERMLFPPQPGDGELWTIEGKGHHIMVQPNSAEWQGAKTNLTVITESNKSYHFELQRVKFDQAYSCVTVTEKGKFFEKMAMNGSTAGNGRSYQTPDERAQGAMQQQIGELQQALLAERELSTERINGVISKYRSMLYTRYDWTEGTGFKGSDLLTDVWDDGRFTFIRVKKDNRGMLAAKAEIDGKEEMIEYKVDSDCVYKISGIYPKFKLIYDKTNSIEVTRRDNQSNGVY